MSLIRWCVGVVYFLGIDVLFHERTFSPRFVNNLIVPTVVQLFVQVS